MKSEVNLSDHYRRDLIEVLSKFSKYNDNRPFKDLTRSNVIAFLDIYRRTEAQDPLHKWIVPYLRKKANLDYATATRGTYTN